LRLAFSVNTSLELTWPIDSVFPNVPFVAGLSN
jgi:hypothetical protein